MKKETSGSDSKSGKKSISASGDRDTTGSKKPDTMQSTQAGLAAQAFLACSVAHDLVQRSAGVPGLSDAVLQLVDAVRLLAAALSGRSAPVAGGENVSS